MRCISAESVNDALSDGLYHLHHFGIEEASRNGPVFVSRQPVMTTFDHPARRVLVSSDRDANPFFHLFEALWMLAGRNDLTFPKTFVSTFGQFSDDGHTLHGAYGFRWRTYFGYDQLAYIIDMLRVDPKTRRVVLSMWDGGHLIGPRGNHVHERTPDLMVAVEGGKDVPCNTHAYFDTIGGKLNMTTVARGLDIVLGAYGANAVHMSILLEYVAAMIGLEIGVYRQFANNYHAYTELYPHLKLDREGLVTLADKVRSSDPYGRPGPLRSLDYDNPRIVPMPLMEPGEEQDWHEDLEAFMSMVDEGIPSHGFDTLFFDKVVGPMYNSWFAWKQGKFELAESHSRNIVANDWRAAALDWLSIRKLRREEKTS